ncbi:hypothetical protein BS47DRAFT_1335729 [Hydnum rufescens UP504]|uniref:FAD/NAD(P)-binding domain-containing protein n=1 Tax=Hydnum rufescens UP504 TaxID=1448309 RepID=A0A9P6BD42_9AGAM|nr:hypothetical protein BS47DRAFT_1335729 [Hydnum rufescens UP504]
MASTISKETPVRQKTEVVIVGGGSGGAALARRLSSAALDFDPEQHNLTLITPDNIASTYPRPPGSLEDTALIPYDKLYTEGNAGRVVHGQVTQILDGSLVLESGESIQYHCLVLATGGRWEGPLAFPDSDAEVREHLRAWRAKFAAAKSVVLVGGGAVGVELACEVKAWYPTTEVTIVHAHSLLLNDAYPDKFRNSTVARVKQFGVNLVLDDKLESLPEGTTTATTTKGQKLTADLFISTRGPKPNTDILKSFDPSVITPSGHVKVLPTLQVPLANGKANLFALGDIIDWNEQHKFTTAVAHGEILVNNVLGAINNGVTPPIPYQGSEESIMITVGPRGGLWFVPKLWGLTFGDWVVSTIKSGLFIPNARALLGY